MTNLRTDAVTAYYRASLVGLRYLDSQHPGRRRFGENADAQWEQFAGHLRLHDRLDLLLRDASITWQAAFSAGRVFQFPALAPDEPFGPDWPGVIEDAARSLWQEAQQQEISNPHVGMAEIVAAWRLQARPYHLPEEPLAPAHRLLVGGLAAIWETGKAFADGEGLSWSDQVLVVSATPAERHLAGLLAVLLRSRGPTNLFAPPTELPDSPLLEPLSQQTGFSSLDRFLLSDDADQPTRAFVQKLQAEMS